MVYVFHVGQRVRVRGTVNQGEIIACVPGNGIDSWYFIRWDNGNEDRYTEAWLEAV